MDRATAGPAVSIVVPVHRSEGCLEELVRRVAETFASIPGGFELVLVDDASPDGSWERLRRLASEHRFVRGARLGRNRGQDVALVVGLRRSRGRAVVTMDDDLQHDPRDARRLLEERERQGVDLCYSRFPEVRHAAWKRGGSWLNGAVACWSLGKPRGLYLSSLKAVDGGLARRAAAQAGEAPYVDGCLLAQSPRIAVLDAEHHERHAGRSHYSLRKSVRRAWWVATGFRRRPWWILLVAGGGVAMAGLGLMLASVAGGLGILIVGGGAASLAALALSSPRGLCPEGQPVDFPVAETTDAPENEA